jgi:hypothetical protein
MDRELRRRASPLRFLIKFYAPIWAREPVRVLARTTPEALLDYLAQVARDRVGVRTPIGIEGWLTRLGSVGLPELRDSRLKFRRSTGEPTAFTARCAPPMRRGGLQRDLQARVEPTASGSRVVGWFQLSARWQLLARLWTAFGVWCAGLTALAVVVQLVQGHVARAGSIAVIIPVAAGVIGGGLGMCVLSLRMAHKDEDALLDLIAAAPAVRSP